MKTATLLLRVGSIAALVSLAAAQSAFVGTWTGAQILEPHMVSSSPPEVPIVVSDASGHAVSVWTSPAMGAVFTERFPGGTWSAVAPIFAGFDGYAPQVAISTSGVVAASWIIPGQEFIPTKLVVSVRPLGGVFSTPHTVATGASLFDSKLGVALNGAVTVVWPQNGAIQMAMRNRAGIWSAAQQISPVGVSANNPDLAVNSVGAAIAVWQQNVAGSPGQSAIGAAYRPARAVTVWGPPQLITAPSAVATWSPRAGISATGDVAVAYGSGNTLMLVTKRATSSFGVPMAVSPPTDAIYSLAFAMDSAGDVLTAWQKLDASNYGAVSKRAMAANGVWGPVTPLSNASEDASAPLAAFSADGSVGIVTWVDNSTFAASAAIGQVRGVWNVTHIGTGWWNTSVAVAAGSNAVSAVWPSPTANPNVTNMVANVYIP